METIQFLAEQYKQGGPFMHPIALAGAISMAICVERIIRLIFQYGVDGTSFMFEIQKHVLANDLDGAIRICNGAGNALSPA